ncbi:MAG: phosphatidylcholine synthase [Legionella sp.]|nr:phosphatidylcholine synthase [Legionella sp.]
MMKNKLSYHPLHYLAAWAVHLFTASAACIGVMTLIKIYQHEYIQALWLMAITIVIDAIDGTFARLVRVKSVLPNIDGTLLDNLVDYFNYVITPCFFLYVKPDMLPAQFLFPIITAVTLTSSYQFCQVDAKTPDHFFKGFPCYWNIAVFYMFIFNTSMFTNTLLLGLLCLLIFIPIKYVYPSRLDYLTKRKALKVVMHGFSLLYGLSSALVLWNYPNIPSIWLFVSIGYVLFYLSISLYRTYSPMTSDV